MRFADPLACPECRGAISGQPECPHCGLDLTSGAVQQVWQLLVQADQVLQGAVQARDAARAAAREPAAPTTPERAASTQLVPDPVSSAAPPPQPAAPQSTSTQAASPPPPAWNPTYLTPAPQAPQAPPASQAKPRRHVSAGAVLLGLGALGLIVAAFIFLTVSWGSLGVAGRALVLLAITALFGFAASWATRRPLRGSAEALWTIFVAMATLDWFVACDQGLLGLDGLQGRPSAIVWALATAPLGAVIVKRGRSPLSLDLVAPMVVTGGAVLIGSATLAVELESRGANLFWSTAVATAVAAGATVLVHRQRLRVSTLIAAATGLVGIVVAVVLAVIEAIVNPSFREMTVEGHAVPMIVVVAALVALGLLVERVTPVASALAGAGTVFLLATAAEDAAPGRGAIVAVAAVALLAGVLLHGPGAWRHGARAVVGVLTIGLTLLAAGWGAEVLDSIATGAGELRTAVIDAGPRDVTGRDVAAQWWLALVVTVALTGIVLAARRWPETASAARRLTPAAAVVAAVGVVITVGAAEPTYVVEAAVIMATAVVLGVLLDRFAMPWQLVPPAAVGLAMVAGLSHDVASTILWAVGGIAFAVMSTRIADRPTRDVLVLATSATTVAVVSFVLDLGGASSAWFALGYVVTAAVLSVVALLLRGPRGVPIEVVAAVTVVVGLMIATAQSDGVVRTGLWASASVALLVLSSGATRTTGAWGSVDRARAYRFAGVVTLLGALLVSLPDTPVALVSWSVGAVLLGGLCWRAVHPWEQRALAFLSSLVGLGALGLGLDRVDALPQTVALSFVVAAALLGLVAHLVGGDRGLPVEVAGGLALAVGLMWTVDVPDVLWRAVTWTVAALLVLALSLLPRDWPGLDRSLVLRIAGAVGLVVGMLVSLPESDVSVGFWAGGAVVLAAISWFTPVRRELEATAFAAAIAMVGTVVLVLDVMDVETTVMSLALVVTAAVLGAAGAGENGLRRIPLEIAGASTAVLGVAVASDTDIAWQAVVWTVLGALVLLVAAARPTPGPRQLVYRATGSASLAVAYVLRLTASDVGVVEAYTLPFALLLLGAGWWTMRREPTRSSVVALGPGLTLALLPSLPQALAEPTGLRALLLGLGAVAVLAIGIRRGWKAPLIAGALIAAVLVLVNVGPYANAAPRVAVIAVISAVLLGIGITWEDRVRDGRRLAAYVRSMR